MLVKDTQLYKEGIKKLENIKSRSLLKIDVIKDRPKKSFIKDFINGLINL